MAERMGYVDIERRVEYIVLDAAEGRIEAGPDQQERLEEFTQRVGSGEFHVQVDNTFPCGCIDGRCGCTMKANTAGGSLSLPVALELIDTTGKLKHKSTQEVFSEVISDLLRQGFPVGGHIDEHADATKTGCGANDKLPEIFEMISRKAAEIRGLATSLGIDVSDSVHERIVGNAAERTDFSPSNEIVDSLKEIGEDSLDRLRGEHKEVIAVINMKAGTTLDRDAVEAEFGPDYQAFNVDAWAFENGARALSEDEEKVSDIVAAMTYYNIATALVLGGKSLRVVVLQ